MILDTNALSAYLDKMPGVVEIVSQSRHPEAHERSLQRMLDRCTVLNVRIEIARHYAAIR